MRMVSPVAPPGMRFPVCTKVLILVAIRIEAKQMVRMRCASFFIVDFIRLSSVCIFSKKNWSSH